MNRRELLTSMAALLPLAAIGLRPDTVVSVANGDAGRVRDANGVDISRCCIEANLTTGRCVVMRRDANDLLVVDGNDELVRDIVYHPSPLTFERNRELEQARRQNHARRT